MEQLKPILEQLKKHHFWILCPLTAITAIAVWYMVTSNLKKTANDQITAINTSFSTLQKIESDQPVPNEHSHTAMDAIIDESSNELARAWDLLYKRQQNVLTWPPELTQEFVDVVEKLRPIEKAVPYDPNNATQPVDPKNEIDVRYKELYQNYIGDVLPTLADSIGAHWSVSRSGVGTSGATPGAMMMPGAEGMTGGDGAAAYDPLGGGSGTEATLDPSVLVNWSANNQRQLVAAHFEWRSLPSTTEILYAQETMWVLEAILRIIQRTNGNIDARYQAAIKDVNEILLGRAALGRYGRITVERSGGGGMGPMGPMGAEGEGNPDGAAAYQMGGASPGAEMTEGTGATGPAGAGAAMGGALRGRDPAEGRYVDEKFEPLDVTKLRQAIADSNARDASLAQFVFAKRVPVRLRLTIDQRRLARLLAECGNDVLPLEVRQVRVNRSSGGGSQGGMGPMMGPMMGPSGGPTYGEGDGATTGFGSPGGFGSTSGFSDGATAGMPGMPGMMGMSGGGSARTVSSSSPFDVPVEIFGIVYLYNPPAIEKLGIDEIAAQPPVDPDATEPAADGAPAAPPADGAPPAAPPGGEVPEGAAPVNAG